MPTISFTIREGRASAIAAAVEALLAHGAETVTVKSPASPATPPPAEPKRGPGRPKSKASKPGPKRGPGRPAKAAPADTDVDVDPFGAPVPKVPPQKARRKVAS